jgi:hypothetical protein
MLGGSWFAGNAGNALMVQFIATVKRLYTRLRCICEV